MTISTTENRINYVGNGSTRDFGFNFKTYDTDHIVVSLDGVVQGSGYVVTLNIDQVATPGGNVEFPVPDPPPASGVAITIERIVPQTQLVDYQPYDPFPAETHERALDLAAMGRQQLDDGDSLALKLPITTTLSNVTYPDGPPNPLLFVRWNAAGTALEAIDIANLGNTPITDFGKELIVTTDAEDAKELLDVLTDILIYG